MNERRIRALPMCSSDPFLCLAKGGVHLQLADLCFQSQGLNFQSLRLDCQSQALGQCLPLLSPNSSYIYVISIPRKMFQPFSGKFFCSDIRRKRGWRAWFLNPSAGFSRGTEERAWAVEQLCLFSALKGLKGWKIKPFSLFSLILRGKSERLKGWNIFRGLILRIYSGKWQGGIGACVEEVSWDFAVMIWKSRVFFVVLPPKIEN